MLLPVVKAEFLSSLLPWWRQRISRSQGQVLPVGPRLCQTCSSMKEWDMTAPGTNLSYWGNREAFWKVPIGWPLSWFGFNIAWWCDEERLFILLSLLFYTLCLSLLMHNLPILLMVRGKVVVLIIITSENPYFFLRFVIDRHCIPPEV